MQLIRWGIIGAGIIADKMANAIKLHKNSVLISVASRTKEKAVSFALSHNIESDTYESLLIREDIDVIYIATTHNFHFDNAMLALNAGKHVLIEKPFTVNAIQAKTLIQLAQEKQCFLMEALWTRFLPSIQYLKSILDGGAIGEIKMFDISFCNIAQGKYLPRLLDPNLAGGVTLDMGIYPISFVNFLMGSLPKQTQSICRFSQTGVDEIASYQMQFNNGVIANINTSFNLFTDNRAMIYGQTGYIEFNHFQQGQTFTIHKHDHSHNVIQSDVKTINNHENGFIYQVNEVFEKIQNGELESNIMPLQETLDTMKLMDDIRKQWGLIYPFE
ncbi:MAG: Gfo/Idh/MocA family oxidoreductase [Saccharospirillaceae bacterium]|nr:Gfo/Idh/MocA family oxidoreductase [Pseudomonadales bacterium]NRB80942.1 Gfo/Idh/MocA family oxidoreductase [Saccharospirillaceae bacterium]